MNSLTISCGKEGVQPFPGEQGSIMIQEGKCHHSKHPSHSSFFPHVAGWAWCHIVWNVPLVSQGQLSHCDPSQMPVHPSFSSLVEWGRSRKYLNSKCWAAIAAQTSLCYLHFFQHKSKCAPMPVTVKKINSIQHKTSTAGTSVRHTCRDKSQTASSPVKQQLLQQCFAPSPPTIFLLLLEKKRSKKTQRLFINYLPIPKLILLACYRLIAPRTKISLRIHCLL